MTTVDQQSIQNTLISVVVNAYECGVIHEDHRPIAVKHRNTAEGTKVQNLVEAFEALGKIQHSKNEETGHPGWGSVEGFKARDIVNQIAFRIVRRATRSVDNLVWQAQEGRKNNGGIVPIEAIATSKDNHVLSDIVMVKTVLDTKGIWLDQRVYQGYLGALEEYQALMGFKFEIDTFCRRLRAVTKPHAPKQVTKLPGNPEENRGLSGSAVATVEAEATETLLSEHNAQVTEYAVNKTDAAIEKLLNEQTPNAADAPTRQVLNDRVIRLLSMGNIKAVKEGQTGGIE